MEKHYMSKDVGIRSNITIKKVRRYMSKDVGVRGDLPTQGPLEPPRCHRFASPGDTTNHHPLMSSFPVDPNDQKRKNCVISLLNTQHIVSQSIVSRISRHTSSVPCNPGYSGCPKRWIHKKCYSGPCGYKML